MGDMKLYRYLVHTAIAVTTQLCTSLEIVN